MGQAGRCRRRVEPTEDWEQLELLCRWPEQLAYEEVRPNLAVNPATYSGSRVAVSAQTCSRY